MFLAALQDFLAGLGYSLLDQSYNLLRARGVDRVAGARDFDRAAGPSSISTGIPNNGMPPVAICTSSIWFELITCLESGERRELIQELLNYRID